MKKIILVTVMTLLFAPKAFAGEENIALLTKKGFFDTPKVQSPFYNSCEEVKKVLLLHLKYANKYKYDELKSLYSENYKNADGLNKELYFDLIKKTWASYPDIKYKIEIKNIDIDGSKAIIQVRENAVASTSAKSGVMDSKGTLESTSNCVYHLEFVDGEWLIVSDYTLNEKTLLRYGAAKFLPVDFEAPYQVEADSQYSAILKINPPKDALVIASIGRENITFPQSVTDEVFRKLPEDGILERMFTSNNKNLNEYAVASFGITKAQVKSPTEVKIYVTGLGFVMSRVNVIAKNEFIKVEKDEQDE